MNCSMYQGSTEHPASNPKRLVFVFDWQTSNADTTPSQESHLWLGERKTPGEEHRFPCDTITGDGEPGSGRRDCPLLGLLAGCSVLPWYIEQFIFGVQYSQRNRLVIMITWEPGLSSFLTMPPRVSGKANKNFAGGDLVGVCPLPESSKNCSEWLS
jgi:hypothetical protein